jgi:hypothetical protein
MVERKEGRRLLGEGDRVDLGRDWTAEVLWPPDGSASGRAEENGLVMILECGEARLLWAGSIPRGVEKKLVERYGEKLKSGVLVQGPSKDVNLTSEWLQAVRPNYLVRSWKALEDDPSLSVDLDQFSKEIGMTLVKLKESGAVQFRPEPQNGGWAVRKWRPE